MDNGDQTVRVGVLSLHNSKETKAICNAISDLGHSAEWIRKENLTIRIEDGTVTVEPEVDIIINRLLLSNSEEPCEEVGLARALSSKIETLNPPEAVLTAIHKFAAATELAEQDLSVPDAFLALDTTTLNEARNGFGDFAVFKTAIGTHGGGTWKVGPEDVIKPTVGNRRAFLQELIDQEGSANTDLRVYVVEETVLGAMERHAPKNDWRTNVALGGEVSDASETVGEDVRELAIEATASLGLDYAGVDIVEGNDGWYVLEVNPTAGFRGFFKATGRSPAPHIAALAINRAGGSVDQSRISDIETKLDDRVPTCKPASKSAYIEQETPIVGLTEEVIVSGTSGSERVVAKADTGADRTSIDTRIAAEVGAGPIRNVARVKSGTSQTTRTRPIVDLVVGIGGDRHTVTASVEDRSHMEYAMLLGRDILKHYRVDVNRQFEDPPGDIPDTEE